MRSSTVRSADVPYSVETRAGLILLRSLFVLAVCCAAIVALRQVVTAEWLDDQTSLGLTAFTAIILGAVALAGLRHAFRRRSWKREGWRRRAAAAILPCGLLALFAAFVTTSVPDASVEMESLVEAREPGTPAATIELGPRGEDIRLAGELQAGVAKRLEALVRANPGVKRIHLTSEGGLADEGQAIGDVIAAHHLSTYVPDFCVSACTLAFVRGRERLVLEESRVGFHAPFEEGLFGTIYQDDSSEQRAQYLAAGISGDFVDAALKVKPDDIWFPKPSRLIAANVATALVDRDTMPDSNLDGAATIEGAKTVLLRDFPVLDAFRARSSTSIDTLARWYLGAYRSGRSEGDDAEDLRTIVGGAVLVALTRADDTVLVEAGRYLASGMAAAADDPEACLRIGSELDVVEAESRIGKHGNGSDDKIAGVTLTGAEALVAAATGGHHALSKHRDGGPLAALADDAEADGTNAARCTAARAAYDALLAQPPAQAAAGLRRLADARALETLDMLKVIAER